MFLEEHSRIVAITFLSSILNFSQKQAREMFLENIAENIFLKELHYCCPSHVIAVDSYFQSKHFREFLMKELPYRCHSRVVAVEVYL